MKTLVSEKGQVTIPKAVRDHLGLRPGSALEFRAEGGRLVGTKIVTTDVFKKWRGTARLPHGRSVDAYVESLRTESLEE